MRERGRTRDRASGRSGVGRRLRQRRLGAAASEASNPSAAWGRPNERRIQVTNVPSIPLRLGVASVLGGWSDEVGVYAFWDAQRHRRFSERSPSFQIGLETLRRAYHDGFAAETRTVREGLETAVGVQPDFLLWYLQQWERLYECGAELAGRPGLVEATPEEEREFVDSGMTPDQCARREKVMQIVRHFRDARFRPAVLRAYNYRCCVSGISLGLVDAAHIIPITDPASSDHPSNGLALCPHLHRAYDQGLLGILPGGRIATNPRTEAKLRRQRLHAGLSTFNSSLPSHMRLPSAAEARPSDRALLRGLQLRGWLASDIGSISA